MSHFVLELGVEEIPARFLASLEREPLETSNGSRLENG